MREGAEMYQAKPDTNNEGGLFLKKALLHC
jgi:hypothetical protein